MASDFEVHDIGTNERLDLVEELQRRLKESQAAGQAVGAKYHELLMEIDSKYEGETRHDTALRWLREYKEAFGFGDA